MENDYINKELEGLSPLLKKLRTEAAKGPEPPEGYLEKFTEQLMEKVDREAPTHKVAAPHRSLGDVVWGWLGPFFQPKPLVAFATVAILVVCGVFVLKQYSNKTDIDTPPLAEELNKVDQEELLAYAEERHYTPIDTVPAKTPGTQASNLPPIDLGAALDSLDISEIEAYLEENPTDVQEEEAEEEWIEL